MSMYKYGPCRYFKGTRDSRESVEFNIYYARSGNFLTTCVVNVDLLMCGIGTHPCGNGDDHRLPPEQALNVLLTVQEERRKLTEGIEVKSLKSWQESGLPYFEDYFQPGDIVEADIVDNLVNSLPPRTLRSTCTQSGEPYSSAKAENGNYYATYTTFHRVEDGKWKYDGECFAGKNENQTHGPSRLEKAITQAREAVERQRRRD